MSLKAQFKTRLPLKELLRKVRWDPARLVIPRLPYSLGLLDRDVAAGLDEIATAYNNPDAEIPQELCMLLDLGDRFEGTIPVFDWFGLNGLYIEDMPIKVPGGLVSIPEVIYKTQFKAIIDECIRFEMRNNPALEDQYLYLTIQQSNVRKDTVQRRAGIHLDGFQKPSIQPQIAQHQLAVTNVVPTRFVAHEYDVDVLPTDKKGMFAGLAVQSEGLSRHEPAPYELHLLNAFCPHEPGFATEDCFRTFIRFSASVIPFMGADNTRNPLLDLEWDEEAKAKYYTSISA